jgi:hypothetical protein
MSPPNNKYDIPKKILLKKKILTSTRKKLNEKIHRPKSEKDATEQ